MIAFYLDFRLIYILMYTLVCFFFIRCYSFYSGVDFSYVQTYCKESTKISVN